MADMDDEPSLRVSDDDRERAVAELREHLLAGRLTLEEFTERVGASLQARVGSELARVKQDLPEVFVTAAPSRRKATRFTAALLGHVARRGRLRLRGWAFAASGFGDLDFDLRDVTVDRWETTVRVLAVFGNVDIYLPEGVDVDVNGVTLLGHRRDWGSRSGTAGAPAVHVRVLGVAGTIDVWRVPRELRGAGYRDIFRQLEGGRRELPG